MFVPNLKIFPKGRNFWNYENGRVRRKPKSLCLHPPVVAGAGALKETIVERTRKLPYYSLTRVKHPPQLRITTVT